MYAHSGRSSSAYTDHTEKSYVTGEIEHRKALGTIRALCGITRYARLISSLPLSESGRAVRVSAMGRERSFNRAAGIMRHESERRHCRRRRARNSPPRSAAAPSPTAARHILLRHRRCRADPRTHLPRPAPRQRARSRAPPQRRPPGRSAPTCCVPREAARTPASHRALRRRSQLPCHTPAHPGADRRKSPPPADRHRFRRHLPRSRHPARPPAVAGTSDRRHQRVRQLHPPGEGHPRPGVSPLSCRVSRIAGTNPAMPRTCRHRTALNLSRSSVIHAVSPLPSNLDPRACASARSSFDRSVVLRQNSSPFFSIPWMPFSPFTVCVTWKSTASEQN